MELINRVEFQFINFLSQHIGVSELNAGYLYSLISLMIIVGLGWVANIFVKRFVLGLVRSVIKKSKTSIGELLVEQKFFHRLSHLAPAFVIVSLSGIVYLNYPFLHELVKIVVNLYLVIIALSVIDSLINAFYKLSEHSKLSSKIPLKGICQAIKILINGTGIIFILSILLDKSPIYFFSGLGALTAVILLVFKDVILGLVAGVQLTANNMVRRGDWIEMPKYGADGDVIDVSLTTVKVQNWDKTVSTIPAHALVSDAFKNWRGMSESGGRRIKRSIHLDLSSLAFLKESEIEELEKIELLRGYFKGKRSDIGEKGLAVEKQGLVAPLLNGRNLTNAGTFRAYCLEYLRANPAIHKEGMTFLVRQLATTDKGLPIEIYVFVNDVRWVQYEAIQSDIFDHLLASLPIFGLRAFQLPSDSSFSHLVQQKA